MTRAILLMALGFSGTLGLLFACLAAVIWWDRYRGRVVRDEFGPLFRDDAGHQRWVAEGLTDFELGETPIFEAATFERWEQELGR